MLLTRECWFLRALVLCQLPPWIDCENLVQRNAHLLIRIHILKLHTLNNQNK